MVMQADAEFITEAAPRLALIATLATTTFGLADGANKAMKQAFGDDRYPGPWTEAAIGFQDGTLMMALIRVCIVVDDDPYKGKVMARPGYNIPILPPAALYERNSAVVVVFAWRYVDPIRAKHARYYAEGGKLIEPPPSIASMGPIDGVRQR